MSKLFIYLQPMLWRGPGRDLQNVFRREEALWPDSQSRDASRVKSAWENKGARRLLFDGREFPSDNDTIEEKQGFMAPRRTYNSLSSTDGMRR